MDLVTCPKCGQVQVRGEDGKCIKCGFKIELSAPEKRDIEPAKSSDLSPQKKKKSVWWKILIAVFTPILALCVVGFLLIKFSGDVGPVSVGDDRYTILETVKGAEKDELTKNISFWAGCPVLPIGPKMNYTVDFSVKGSSAQYIRSLYIGKFNDTNTLYKLLRFALTLKYGEQNNEENLLDMSFKNVWEVDSKEITLTYTILDKDNCFLRFEAQDTESYEYQTIQDGRYVKYDIPAYSGKLIGDQEGFGDAVFVHYETSNNNDLKETLEQYERSLILDGYSLSLGESGEIPVWYEKNGVTISVTDGTPNDGKVIIYCEGVG